MALGLQPDVRGVAVLGAPPWLSGNYFYLRRDVVLMHEWREDARINYLVVGPKAEMPAGWRQIDDYRGWRIFRNLGP
jgi:hypothetical protein